MKHLEWRKYREEKSKRLGCHAVFTHIMISSHEMMPGIGILDVNLRSKGAKERVEFSKIFEARYN